MIYLNKLDKLCYRSVGERLRKAETSLFITQFVELDYSQDKIKNKITENSKVIEDYQRKISNLETKKLNFLMNYHL